MYSPLVSGLWKPVYQQLITYFVTFCWASLWVMQSFFSIFVQCALPYAIIGVILYLVWTFCVQLVGRRLCAHLQINLWSWVLTTFCWPCFHMLGKWALQYFVDRSLSTSLVGKTIAVTDVVGIQAASQGNVLLSVFTALMVFALGYV
jgi:hypothetical protein